MIAYYYRVTKDIHEKEVIFHPKAVYEQVAFVDGKWIEVVDKTAPKPLAVCFSKGIVNAFFAISMFLKEGETYSIYRTEEPPCLDLEPVTVGDFQSTREVRYHKPVKAIKIGTLQIEGPFHYAIQALYDNNSFSHVNFFDHHTVLHELNTYYHQLADEIDWETGCRCSVL